MDGVMAPPAQRLKRAAAHGSFTLKDLLVVFGVTALLVFVVFVQYPRARDGAWFIRCTSHLKQIGLSFKTFAIDNNEKYPFELSVTNWGTMEMITNKAVWPHYAVMSNELSTPKILVCPADRQRSPADSFLNVLPDSAKHAVPFDDRHLSYFVGVDGTQELPNSLLSGDRFLGMNGERLSPGLRFVSTNQVLRWVKSWHYQGRGNLLLGDGSVQQASSSRMQELFIAGGIETNRFLIP